SRSLMSEISLEGGCQCRAVRYRVAGQPLLAAICHCTMCRRANAAPVVAWAMYNVTQVQFVGLPKTYESSRGCLRGFCAGCGTQISFIADSLPGLIDLPIGSLKDPGRLPPALHYWESRRLPWVHFADEL